MTSNMDGVIPGPETWEDMALFPDGDGVQQCVRACTVVLMASDLSSEVVPYNE